MAAGERTKERTKGRTGGRTAYGHGHGQNYIPSRSAGGNNYKTTRMQTFSPTHTHATRNATDRCEQYRLLTPSKVHLQT